MSDHASRGRGFERERAPRSRVDSPAATQRTPAEEASERAFAFAREVAAVDHAIEEVRRASASNDPQAWRDAKLNLERQLAAAHRSHERIRERATAAMPEAQQQVAAAEAMLAEHERVVTTLTEAPRGWTEVSREAEILAIAKAPIEGNVREGWARKMAALKSTLVALPAAESRALAVRLQKQQPNDPIAIALAPGVRITRERFGEILNFLDGARRREALRPTMPAPPMSAVMPTIAVPAAAPATRPMDVLRLDPDSDIAPAKPAQRHVAEKRGVPRAATRLYLQTNSNVIWRVVRSHLHATSWPAATDQLTWLEPKMFSDSVVDALHDKVMSGAKGGDIDPAQLDALLYPYRVHDEIAGLVPQRDAQSFATTWVPAIGLRIAQLVHSALVPSVLRMTQRYIDAANVRAEQAKHEIVKLDAKDLIASSPLDRIVARKLVAPGIVEVVPNAGVKPKARTSLRRVRLTWEGQHDPKLWTWVRADLADATPEEVAASLFGYARDAGGDATSYYAYGIATAPPLFGLPASWAIQFPDARAHAPDAVKQGSLPDEQSDSIPTRLAGLAATNAGDTIALQQAGKPIAKADPDAVVAAVDDALIQLEVLRKVLVPWGLANDLVPVIFHLVAKKEQLKSAPAHDVKAYAAVAFGQRDRLAQISGRVTAAIASAGKMSEARDEDNPVRPILAWYARAAASAQLATTCNELIASAEGEQRGLLIKALRANQLASMQAMHEMQSGPAMKDPQPLKDERTPMEIAMKRPAKVDHRPSSRAARDLSGPYLDVQDRTRILENKLLQGEEVDPDELQRVQLESQELALNARIQNLTAHLQIIDEEADNANSGLAAKIASLGSSRFRGLRDASKEIRNALVMIRHDLIVEQKFPKPRSGDADGLTPPPYDVLAKREALARAQARFTRLSDDRELGTFLENAYKAIQNQRLRTAIVNAAASIGLSFAGSALSALVAERVGGALVTAEGVKDVTELSLRARMGIFAARVATDSVVNSAGQVALTGGDPWEVLLENTLMSLGMEGTTAAIAKDVGAARAFHKQLAAQSAKLEAVEARAASKLGKAGRLVGYEALAISGHAIMGMALGALSAKALAALDDKQPRAQVGPGSQDFLIQSACVAIGRFVHARVAQRQRSLNELARHSGDADARHLADHATQLEKLSEALVNAPNAERALDVLAHQERLIQEEIRVLDDLAARPGRGGYTADELARTKAELSAQLGNAGDVTMLAVKLHLTGLRELAPGTLWSGTPQEIARGVGEIRASRPDAQIHQELGTTTVRVGDHTFEFHEVAAPRKERASADHAQTRPPDATHALANTVVRVPGSEMRGGTKGVPTASPGHTDELLAAAKATASRVLVPGVSDLRPSSKPGTYLVMLSDLSWTSIEVSIARTDGSNPAHLVPNSSRVTHVDGIAVRGEHVLQISDRLPLDQVDRVVAHGIARLIDAHRKAVRGQYAGDETSVLSPDDRGRIAEMVVLSRTAANGEAAAAARARAELRMLTEYLGIRDGAPMANERRSAIDAELKQSPEARAELARALREPLTDVQRKAALDDLAAEQADHQQRSPRHAGPPSMTKPGARLTREQIAQYASVAARLRHLVSQRTIAKYRAQQAQHPGQRPRIETVQIGAGAALAGRDPRTLLVDARGRWQSDASENIAQVGQQLQDLYRARFGDVREVAGPGERIPLDAIRYWEDSLAAQGDVIDGHGTLRTDNGALLLDIKPTDGSAALTLEVGGTVVSAPGFPSENIPGGAWGVGAGEAMLSIERALAKLAERKGPAGEHAKTALARMQQIKGTRDTDLSRVAEILHGMPPDVLAELRAIPQPTASLNGKDTPDGIDTAKALDAVAGREKWDALVKQDAADGDRQVFFSKEANDESIKKSAREHDDKERTWVFAGAGGNAVSAAEIILANTTKAKVSLVARNTPPGLFQNGQFRAMAEKHGDSTVADKAKEEGVTIDTSKTSKRLHVVIDKDIDFSTPVLETRTDGSQEIVLHSKQKGEDAATIGPYKDPKSKRALGGDMFVTALGSPGQLPPEIGALAQEARRKYPTSATSPEKQRPVWIEADFAADGRYLGYTVHIRIGPDYRAFEVRGAASRGGFVPREEFLRMHDGEETLVRINHADVEDAPAKSGNFAGSLGPTATQTSQQHRERKRKSP